jgi:hypothetical protein
MKSGFLNKSDCTRIEKGFAKNVNQGERVEIIGTGAGVLI